MGLECTIQSIIIFNLLSDIFTVQDNFEFTLLGVAIRDVKSPYSKNTHKIPLLTTTLSNYTVSSELLETPPQKFYHY